MPSRDRNNRLGEIVLIVVASVWGSAFPVTRSLLQEMQPGQIMFIRFALAVTILAPLAFYLRRQFKRSWIKPGLLCGGLLGCTFTCAVSAVVYTSATRAAFIACLFVVLTPFVSYIFFKIKPAGRTLIGVAFAIAGSWLLTGMDQAQDLPFNRGDLLALGCAFCASAHIQAVDRYAKKIPSFWVYYMQSCCAGLVGLIWCGTCSEVSLNLSHEAWINLVFLVLVCTIFTFWAQIWGQARTTANRAAVIFALEPVAAAVSAYYLLGEVMGSWGLFGSALILTGVVVVAISPKPLDPAGSIMAGEPPGAA
jgi:drug/metabolite transporter (DMT)-like permease